MSNKRFMEMVLAALLYEFVVQHHLSDEEGDAETKLCNARCVFLILETLKAPED